MAMQGLHAAFQRAAASVPAYRRLLREHGVDPAAIVDYDTFAARCPILTKANTFDRFPIDQLCAEGAMRDLADVLTSSGHGGRFSFGLSTRRQQADAPAMIDYALDDAFRISERRTLVVNCLPMGVGFSSATATVATTSVREDMATALVTTFGAHYDQIVIVTDPLFVRRLLDYARDSGVDWRRYRLGIVIGEEIFGEQFRSYVAHRVGLDVEHPEDGYIMSSFGVGELGLHLCFETPATIALRRAAARDAGLARELFGDFAVLPTVLAYNPQRTLIEAVDPDAAGYGRLTISMLDTALPVPLLRYQTGDVVRMLDSQRVAACLKERGYTLPAPLPGTMLALAGREKDKLPGGSHVGVYKDALYADATVADRLTGAFRVTCSEYGFVEMHVQLVRGARADREFEDRLRAALEIPAHAGRVIASSYECFPYGMGLDYERKFAYYAAGSTAAA
jgi:phenylacetate-coenzyme A ligase PaaK-like adenylate-forming protein